MKHWSDGIKKRRKERLRHLRQETGRTALSRRDDIRSPYYSWYFSDYQGDYAQPGTDYLRRPSYGTEYARPRKWLVQTVASLFILGFVYAIFHWNVPLGEKIRPFVSEVMERDFNFAGMAAWYRERFGDNLTILPTLATKNNQEQAVFTGANFTSPVQGEVIMPFYKDGQGVWIGLKKGNSVHAANMGWVVFSGKKEGLGKTVVIRHRNGVETWYARLAEIQVKKNAWVQTGDIIGTVATAGADNGATGAEEAVQANGEGGMLYFALRANGRFVDPVGVIPFE